MLEYIKELLKSMSGLKIGDIDIGDQVIDNEFRIKFLTKIVNYLLTHSDRPTQEMINQWRDETIQELQRKYPNNGIEYNEEKR